MTSEAQAQGKWWVAPRDTPVTYCVALGATLRHLRSTVGRSRAEVAFTVLGTTTNQLGRYESGEAKAPLRVIAALCEVYGANPIELLTRVAIAVHPGAAEFELLTGAFEPLPGMWRSFAVVLLHDEAVSLRAQVERRRAEVRRQPAVEDTTSP